MILPSHQGKARRRLAWITDIQLDHIDARRRDRFFREIVETGASVTLTEKQPETGAPAPPASALGSGC